MKKRVLSFVLVLCLVAACLPLSVRATENWLWPAEGCYVISSNFGYRSDGTSTHNGIDIVCKSGGTSGKPVRASKSGTIYQGHNTMADNTYYASGTNSMGNYTMVNHGDGTYAVYMHMKPGNKVTGSVKQGDIIGYIGKTGASSGAHLHFEIYTNANNRKGSNLNPMPTNSEITLNNAYNLPSGWASQKTTYYFSTSPSPSTSTVSKITLDAQGGSCSQSVIYRDWGDDWDLPTATRSGYKFEGWFSEKNGKGSNYSKEERFWGKNETKTVYAYWTLSSQDWGEGTPGSPTSVSVKTDKSTYTLGETVKVTPSSTGGKKYTIHFEQNGAIVYHDWDGFTGSMTYKPTKAGTYKVVVSAENDYGYRDATTTFVVEEVKTGKINVNGYLNGEKQSSIKGWATFDLYINGKQVENDISDYYTDWPIGTKYEIKDIKAAPGKKFNGLHTGSLSGTVNGYTELRFDISEISEPVNVSVKTDKSVYSLGETVIISFSGDNVSYYRVSVREAANPDNVLYWPDQNFTGSATYRTEKAGDFVIYTSAYDSDGKYHPGATCTFSVKDSSDTPLDPTPENSFIDVPNGAYYAKSVNWAVDRGITAGTTESTFSPNQPCTRAQAVTFLWRAAGSPKPKGSNTKFTDVTAGHYYTDAVQWAVENGITGGTTPTTFSPNDKCTRAQIVCFLHRFHHSPAPAGVSPFTDVPVSVYYSNSVAWAVENGITSGISSTQFGPFNDCSRGQIVTFLYRDLA